MIFSGRQLGFTLIEVISAAVIMSVALAIVVGSIAHSIAASRDIEFATKAQQICSEQLTRAAVGEIEKFPATGEKVFPRITYQWTISSQPVSQGDSNVAVLTCEVKYNSDSVSLQRRIPNIAGSSDATE